MIPNNEVTVRLKQNSYYGFSNCLEVDIFDKDKKRLLTYEL